MNSPLLDGRLSLLTQSMAFVSAPLDVAAAWFSRWQEELQAPRGVTIRSSPLCGSLDSHLDRLLPLTAVELRRFIWVETHGPFTAFFDNGWQGTDTSYLGHIASALPARTVGVMASPVEHGFGGLSFAVYSAAPGPLNLARSVSLTCDASRWRFEQYGTPLDCEKPERYRSKRAQDRFDFDELESCLKSLGIDAFERGWYGTNAILVEKVGPSVPGIRTYSIEDVSALRKNQGF